LLVGERFQAAMDLVGLPKGLFTTLTLDHPATEKLISSRAVDHVNFTGSVAGGRAVERAAAGTFIGLGLELGGKDPAYVRPDADLDFAVEQLVDGAFYNSGQCCCGIERIYVHERIHDRFAEAFAAAASRYHLGNPLSRDTTLG
ncbi:aldehyde dehydrogenase family protein, partial [Staphylococcus sp. EG-SA-1]|uniref:aldehyde dehydrogenase family protein n=1 Tax=Staphylococcus sp. EG-SA-1 TaxID=2767484 RepID=UPI00197EC47B